MARYKVVVTDDRFGYLDEERSVLDAIDAELVVADCSSSAEVATRCADADAVIVNLAPVDAYALSAMAKCRVVSRYGSGFDNVDAAAAGRLGIWAAAVPGYCDEEVAEHALALLFACARSLVPIDRGVRSGGWNLAFPAKSISGSSLGILGFGGGARALARRALSLGFSDIRAWSPSLTDEKIATALGREAQAIRASTFDETVASSDYLSIHLPLKNETRHIIDAGVLARMPRGAVLINTARGGLVDEAALASALASGALSGAGLDVFEKEPLGADSPLKGLDSVVLSDHRAYRSPRSIATLKRRAAENVKATLERGRPLWPVNKPEHPRTDRGALP